MGQDKIPIKNKYGGIFWVDKEEYESTYRGVKGAELGYDELDPHKETQIAYNTFESKIRNISEKVYKANRYGNDAKDVDDNIKDTLSEIKEYKKNHISESKRFESFEEQLNRLRKTLKKG